MQPQSIHSPSHRQEEWRPVYGLEGRYEVSNLGRVRRVARRCYRDHVMTQRFINSGYPVVSLTTARAERRLTCLVHRLVAEAFLGPCPPGHWVHHRDGNKHNPRLDNLEFATPGENMTRAHRDGLLVPTRGVARPGAKLTEDDVRAIRNSPESHRKVAARYGIGATTARKIRDRSKWSHVD